jgi:hypothetical protein
LIDYESSFANTNGDPFPDTAAVNVSGAGAQDGTEFIAAFVDDLWGFNQALMEYAGLTPDTVPESADASQRLEALKLAFSPPGVGFEWWRSDDPTTEGIRVLYLNGQGILRANYPDLDAACYVGNANNAAASAWYRANNADGSSRSTTGAYLILPETRGYVLRGLDTSGTIDPGGATRDIGNIQGDAFQGHQHQVVPRDALGGSGFFAYGAGATAAAVATTSIVTDGTSGTPRTSTETRMKNVAVKFVVRY